MSLTSSTMLAVASVMLVVLTSTVLQSNQSVQTLAQRVAADSFNYTRIKQTVASLRALQETDPDFWSPYLQAVYDNAVPNKKHCGEPAPAYSLLVFMRHIEFHGEDDNAVMYFAGLQNDPRAIPADVRDLFVAMRRNACGNE